jgi:beta-glucanase (GH16 family)
VANGKLTLLGYKDPAYGNRFVTAGVSTAHGFVQTYGKYRVRFRMDAGRGIAHAIMLWPANNVWPPEIDFSEDNGVTPRSLLTTTLHYSTPTKSNVMVHRATPVDFSQWHTLGVEWMPGKVTYTLDSAIWSTVTDVNVSNVPMALAMQTQAWSCGTNNWEACPDGTTPANVNMEIDWVVAYAPS